jgi:hypothetical protein
MSLLCDLHSWFGESYAFPENMSCPVAFPPYLAASCPYRFPPSPAPAEGPILKYPHEPESLLGKQ